MKKLLFCIVFLLLSNTAVFAQKTNYCIIDSRYILEKLDDYKEAQLKLDNISKSWQDEIDKKMAEVDDMYKSYQAERPMLSDEMRKRREDEIVAKEKAAKDLQKQRFGYEGDLFKMGTRGGNIFVDHESVIPRKNDVIIACYLRITRNDDSVDYKVLTMPEIEKLRKFSKDPNSKAWTDGLPGMVQAKTIKHAFKSYPKLRILEKSKFTALASETVDEDAEVVEQDIYGLENTEQSTGQYQATMIVSPAQKVGDDEFMQEKPSVQNTLTIEDDQF